MARTLFALALLALVTIAAPARADDDVEAARKHYTDGQQLVTESRWGEALAAFERSAALRPHALTRFNIGACERSLSHYTRARAALRKSLEENTAAGGSALATSYVSDAKVWLDEIEKLLVRLDLTVTPADAAVTVDGRPLVADADSWIANLADAGPGVRAAGGRFRVVMDPGQHVLGFSRAGFSDAVVNRSYSPGAAQSLKLELDRLPATIRVAADQPGALVVIDGRDVGYAPVEVSRPAGMYRVVVSKPGFDSYVTSVSVAPGQDSDLRATLKLERLPITQRWWFWTAAGVIVAGAAVSTYALTRPTPDRAQPDGGGLNWVVRTH